MKAAVVERKGVIAIKDIPVPRCGDDQVRIRVKACGICGTDLRIYKKGDHRAAYPIVIGHEIAGIIEHVGKDVHGFRVGDRVCVAPGHGCGTCAMCTKGHLNLCLTPCPSIGFASDGGLAEYMVPPPNVLRNGFVNKIPDGLSFEEATLAEPLACCINGQRNVGITKDDVVLIYGAGPIGCMHLALARRAGAARIYLADLNPERLAVAARFGADVLIDASKERVTNVIRQAHPDGIDVVIVAAPARAAQEEGFSLLGPRGRINLFGGLPKDDKDIALDANRIHYLELAVTGASSSLPGTNREALRMLAAGELQGASFITHRITLDEIERGFEIIQRADGIKVVVTL